MISLQHIVTIAIAGVAAAANFDGQGQIRTRWHEQAEGFPDIGCLTNKGQWTVDESLCGTFTGARYDLHNLTLATSEGTCWTIGAVFKCEPPAATHYFGVCSMSFVEVAGFISTVCG